MSIGWEGGLLLGLLQGIAEWLPVSSEGLVAAAYSLAYGRDLGEGIEYALWLHAGTAPAALVALRREAADAVRNIVASPLQLNPATTLLLWSTLISGIIGLPLLLVITQDSEVSGEAVMAVIGAAMLATGAVQAVQPRGGERRADQASKMDGILAGLAQGVSVVPGLSRSGLTVAMLLGRGFQGNDALTLSFLMSVPVGLGAAVYAGISGSVEVSAESFAALAAAFVAGLVSIRLLLRLAVRLNYAYFLFAVGAVMLAGSIWQIAG